MILTYKGLHWSQMNPSDHDIFEFFKYNKKFQDLVLKEMEYSEHSKVLAYGTIDINGENFPILKDLFTNFKPISQKIILFLMLI